MKLMAAVIVLTVCVFAVGTQAGGFKCNNQFVSIGDRKATVLLRCGEPLFAEVVSGDDDVKVEEWTYEPRGYKGFLRVLTFRGGRLMDISVAEKLN